MDIRKWAWGFGVALIALGILGFIPGITNNGLMFGVFRVDTTHNLVHLISGILAIVAATSVGAAISYFRIFGIVYALVLVIGLIQKHTVLNLFSVNTADHILHLVIAGLALMLGFMPTFVNTQPKARRSY